MPIQMKAAKVNFPPAEEWKKWKVVFSWTHLGDLGLWGGNVSCQLLLLLCAIPDLPTQPKISVFLFRMYNLQASYCNTSSLVSSIHSVLVVLYGFLVIVNELHCKKVVGKWSVGGQYSKWLVDGW